MAATGTTTFKVGDKVRRKKEYQDSLWAQGDRVVTVTYVSKFGDIIVTDNVVDWKPWKFDLVQAADAASAPEPSPFSFSSLAAELADVVTKKNAAYGDSYAKAEAFLRILYPDGVKPEAYGDLLTITRLWDKLMRVASGNSTAFGESAWDDIFGYALLAVRRARVGTGSPK